MISIISPAKSMDFESVAPSDASSKAAMGAKSLAILAELRAHSAAEISKLMKVSEKIAELNYERLQNYDNAPEKQAIFAYAGDVYNNIDSSSWKDGELVFAQDHLRIISALYGPLKPLDKIKPYRLEMVTKLADIAPKGLAKLWQHDVTAAMNAELKMHKNKLLLNIASNEYSAAIDIKSLNVLMVNIHFREKRDGVLRNIALNSKRARGMMADYIVQNKIDDAESTKGFCESGYQFDYAMSDEGNFFFVK